MATHRRNPTPPDAGIYIRSEHEPLHLFEQEEACRQLAAEKGWNVKWVITEPSPTKWSRPGARPGLDKLIELLEQNEIDAVIGLSPDQFARDAVELVRLDRAIRSAGAWVATVDRGIWS